MGKKLSLSIFLKSLLFLLVLAFYVVIFAGCAAENPTALAVEKLHGEPPKQEYVSMELDARGIINGVYQPGDITPYEPNFYPVNYTGDWHLINAGTRSNHYTITTDKVGARVDIVATLSRAVFDFWDYEFYDSPGRVSFYIDEQPLGTFNLARSDAEGQKVLNYQVATQKYGGYHYHDFRGRPGYYFGLPV